MYRKNILIYLFFFFVICFSLEAYSTNASGNTLVDRSTLLSFPSFPNYTLIEQKDIGEYKRVFWFRHNRTRADIVYTQDLLGVNQVLSISLHTVPSDDSGVFHIIEHAILDSSKKYDVHNLFSRVQASNIVTEMNAYTFMGRTKYIAASYNRESFINLSNVYLDCIFNSNIEKYPEIFYREGIRREFDSNNYLTYNGIVFNEVRNSLDFRNVLDRQYRRVLLRGSGYDYDYGGDVLSMVDLSYEYFLKMYKKYYHPSNALIYFYGNSSLDIEERLRYLDENYLSKYDYNPEFEKEKKKRKVGSVSNRTKIYKDQYYAGELYTVETDSAIVLGYRIDQDDLEYVTVLNLIMSLLFNEESSKYRQYLLDSNLFGNIEAFVNILNGYSIAVITIKEADIQHLDLIKKKINEVFETVFKSDISYDKKVLKSLLDREIFLQKKEKSNVSVDASDHMNIEQGWATNGNPLSYLGIEDLLNKLNSILKEPDSKFKSSIFTSVLKSGFLKNKNSYTGILSPNHELMNDRNEDLYDRAFEEESNLTSDDINNIKKISEDIKRLDESDYSLIVNDSIPSISIESIKQQSKEVHIPLSREKNIGDGIKILEFDSEVEEIDHIEMFWGLSHLQEGELSWLSLILEIMSNVSTTSMDSLEINQRLNVLGDIFDEFRWLVTEDNRIIPTLVISIDYLKENQEKMFALMHDIIFNTKFIEKDKIKSLITNIYLRGKKYSREYGNDFGDDISYKFSYIEKLRSITSGAYYLSLIETIVLQMDDDRYYDSFISLLQSVYKKVFLDGSCVIGVRSKEERFNDIELGIGRYFNKKYDPMFFRAMDPKVEFYKKFRDMNVSLNEEESEGYLLFVSSMNPELAKSGVSNVVSNFLNTYYLYPRIRNEGGAYSLKLTVSNNGVLRFSSFADPNARSTLEVVRGIPSFLGRVRNIDRKYLDRIEDNVRIAALSEFDIPKHISSIASISFNRFFTGYTDENSQRKREDMINFSFQKDLQECILYFSESIEEGEYKGTIPSVDIHENDKLFMNANVR